MSRDRVAAEEMVRRTGQMGVPVTQIGGELVIGFDRARLAQIIAGLRAAAPPQPSLGAAVKDAPAGGALVGSVRPGSPADRAGLQPGDVIMHVDDHTVSNADSLARAIGQARPHGRAVLRVRRGDQMHTLLAQFSGN